MLKNILMMIAFPTIFCVRPEDTTPIPSSYHQMILVVTDSIKATKGTLACFERDGNRGWKSSGDAIPVVLGRNGLGWGMDFDMPSTTHFPYKKEGDGRSPAGVFTLSSVFGFQPAVELKKLKMPYIHITEMIECVDDSNSVYYNQIVSRDSIGKNTEADWTSSEKMRSYGISYQWGVVVDYNCDPVQKGAGSCIFLHVASDPYGTTAGCTAMALSKMEEIALWLDAGKHPVLVQLTKPLYIDLRRRWGLPEMP